MTANPSDAPEVRAILGWHEARRDLYPDAPFWSEFQRAIDADLAYALRMLQAAAERRPSDLLRCPRAGGQQSPERLRVLANIAYLLGDWTPPDLPPVPVPWGWPAIVALAESLSGSGGDGREWAWFADSRRGPYLYRRARDAGMNVPAFGPERLAAVIVPMLRSLATLATASVPVATFTPAATVKAA